MATHDKSKKKRRRGKYSSLKQTLEPRMLFDASIAAAPTDPAILADNAPTATHTDVNHPDPSTHEQPSSPAMATSPDKSTTNEAGSVAAPHDPNADQSFGADHSLDLQEFNAFQPPDPVQVIFIRGDFC